MSIHAASGDVNCLVAMSQWHFAAGAMDGSLRLIHAERGAPCAVRRHSQSSGPVLSLLFLRRAEVRWQVTVRLSVPLKILLNPFKKSFKKFFAFLLKLILHVEVSLPNSSRGDDSPLESPQASSRVSTPRSPMTRARSDPSEDLPWLRCKSRVKKTSQVRPHDGSTRGARCGSGQAGGHGPVPSLHFISFHFFSSLFFSSLFFSSLLFSPLLRREVSSGYCRRPPTSCAFGTCRPSWRM